MFKAPNCWCCGRKEHFNGYGCNNPECKEYYKMNLIRECGVRQKQNKEQRKTMKQIPTSDLNTDNYTQIFHEDEPKFNTPHHFEIKRRSDGETIAKIDMQEGPILESGVNGCCNEDLINIVVARLEGFQASPYACRENAIAITKLEEALLWLHHRTNKRKARGVEGTHTI